MTKMMNNKTNSTKHERSHPISRRVARRWRTWCVRAAAGPPSSDEITRGEWEDFKGQWLRIQARRKWFTRPVSQDTGTEEMLHTIVSQDTGTEEMLHTTSGSGYRHAGGNGLHDQWLRIQARRKWFTRQWFRIQARRKCFTRPVAQDTGMEEMLSSKSITRATWLAWTDGTPSPA